MITVSNLGMQFGGQWLFQHVDLQFLPGNCYGIIGANGAGKSTFLRILTGELDSTTGAISIEAGKRVSVLKQNQNAYDEYSILDTVIMGNQHLYDVMKEKDAIYEKEDFSDEDGLRAADLEAEFAELGGWEAESDASRLLQGLGIGTDMHYDMMADTDPRLKVKVLLAQALEQTACVGLCFPAAHFGKLCLQVGGTETVLVGEVGLFVDGVLFLHHVIQVLVAHDDGVENGVIVVGVLVLLQNGQTLALFNGDSAGGGIQLTGEDSQEGGLAGAVGTDDAVAVAGEELEVNVLEQPLTAELHAEVGYCNHCVLLIYNIFSKRFQDAECSCAHNSTHTYTL